MKMSKTKINDFKYTITGEYGYAAFEIDRDNNLILTFKDGKTYRKGLQDELTAPRVHQTTIEKHVNKFYQWIKKEVYNDNVPM